MEIEFFKFKLKGKTFVIIDWANVYGWFSDSNSRTYLGWEVDPKKLFTYLKSYSNIIDINFYFGVESSRLKSVSFKKEIGNIGYFHISKEVKWVPAALETTTHFKVLVRRLFNALDNIKNTNLAISNRMHDSFRVIEEVLESGYNRSTIGKSAYIKLIKELDEDLQKLNIDITELQVLLKEPVQRRKCDFDVEISRDIYNNIRNFETMIIFSGDGDYAALVEDLILKGKKVIVVFAAGHKGKEYEDFKRGLFLCPIKKLKPFIAK